MLVKDHVICPNMFHVWNNGDTKNVKKKVPSVSLKTMAWKVALHPDRIINKRIAEYKYKLVDTRKI